MFKGSLFGSLTTMNTRAHSRLEHPPRSVMVLAAPVPAARAQSLCPQHQNCSCTYSFTSDVVGNGGDACSVRARLRERVSVPVPTTAARMRVAHAPDQGEGGFSRSLSTVSATPLMLEDAEEGNAPPHPGAGESGVAPKRGGSFMRRRKSSYGAPASSMQGLPGCDGAPQAGILAWSTDDVCEWLVREGMECVAGAARERRIDGRDLIHFDQECWSELGVSAALDRARLMARLQEASKEAAAAEQAAAPRDRSQRGRAVGAAGAWACLTKRTFPRSHPVAVDHLKEWHRIADVRVFKWECQEIVEKEPLRFFFSPGTKSEWSV